MLLPGTVKGWFLAGGLEPGNVQRAINIAKPTGVDVSSGVAGIDGKIDAPSYAMHCP